MDVTARRLRERATRGRLAVGVLLPLGLGVVFALANSQLYQQFLEHTPRPEQAQVTGKELTFGWALVYVGIAHLLPYLVVWFSATDRVTKTVGIAVYAVSWAVVARFVTTGPRATAFHAVALGVVVFGALTYWVYSGPWTPVPEPRNW